MLTLLRAAPAPLLLLLATTLLPAVAQDGGPEVLVNGDFNQDADQNGLPDAWSTDAERALYREITAFGKDYELVSRPGAYVLATQDIRLEPGRTYTITLECRGTPDALAGALIVHGSEKPQTEMALLWRQRLSEEWGLYSRTFTAPNPVARLFIYNVAKVGEVAYRRVSLIRGTPDYPLVRDLYFGDRDTPDEAPRETPHEPFATPLHDGPITALFTVYSYRSIREHLELANRVELDYDLLHTGPDGTDTASETGRRTQRRLIEHGYDAYVVASRLTEAFQKHFAAELTAGKGLVCVQGFGRPTGLFDPQQLEAVGDDHYLRRDLPWSRLPGDMLAEVRAGQVGQGRAVWLQFPNETARVWGIWPVSLSHEDYQRRTMRHDEYWLAFLARCLAWAAGRDAPTHAAIAADDQGVQVTVAEPGPGTSLQVRLRSGREVRFGRPDLSFEPVAGAAPELRVTYPEGFPAGRGVADVRLLDGEAKVTYWAALPFDRPQAAAFTELTVEPGVLRRGEAVRVRVGTSAKPPVRVEAELTDAWGRRYAVARENVAADGSASLVLPTARSLTTGNKLAVVLRDAAGHELDSAWRDVYLPEINRQDAWSDFHVTAWGDGYTHPVLSHTYNQMMRELGLNGKFSSYRYGAVEDNLWPSDSAGAGLFPGGRRSPERIRPSGCLSDPAFFQAMDQRMADRLTANPELGTVAWSLGDEISLTNRHEVDEVDCAPPSVAAFHAWLEERYGTIAALNEQWGSRYADFDAIVPAATGDVRGTDNFAPFVDFRTFMTDEWVKALTHASDQVRQHDPEARVGHTNTFGSLPFNGVDFWKICTVPGFTWGQEYSEAIKGSPQKAVFAFWRSFCPDDMPNLGWIGYDHRPAAVRYEPWWLALHGSRGVSYFATNACDPERGTSWALIHPTQSLTPYSHDVQAALTDLLDGCGKALMETAEVPPQVAILWSHPSMLASWCESTYDKPEPPDKPPFDSWGAYFRSALNFRLCCEELQVAYRYVAPEQLAADPTVLDRYKLLFLPCVNACDRGTIDTIKAWRDRGGFVMADIDALRYDEHGTPWRGASPLTELFGVTATGPTTWQASKVSDATGQGDPGMGFESWGRQPVEVVAPAMAIAKHDDGTPALIMGRNSAYLNALLPADSPMVVAGLGMLMGQLGLNAPVEVRRLDGKAELTAVEVTRRAVGDLELVGAIRDFRRVPADETEPPRLSLAFGRKAWVTDLRARQPLGQVDHIDIALAGGDARLFALLPYQVTGLTLTAPDRVRIGGNLPVEAKVQAQGELAKHVFHVELRGPDGEVRPAYRLNVAAPGGSWSHTFALALNDPQGNWELRVRDVVGGVEVVQGVVVEVGE